MTSYWSADFMVVPCLQIATATDRGVREISARETGTAPSVAVARGCKTSARFPRQASVVAQHAHETKNHSRRYAAKLTTTGMLRLPAPPGSRRHGWRFHCPQSWARTSLTSTSMPPTIGPGVEAVLTMRWNSTAAGNRSPRDQDRVCHAQRCPGVRELPMTPSAAAHLQAFTPP